MQGRETTKEQLTRELEETRRRVSELEAALAGSNEQLTTEIEEHEAAEAALRESEKRLLLALDAANLGIWLWDLTTGKVVSTDRTNAILGYESKKFKPDLKTWKRLVHSDDWPKVSERLNLHLEAKVPMFEAEYRIRDKSRKWQWIRERGKVVEFDVSGKPTRMAGIVSNITDRKEAEEALRESEAKYRFFSDHATDIVWTTDLNMHVTFVSPSIEKVLGFTPEERVQQDVEAQLTPESLELARQRLLEELRSEGEEGIQPDRSAVLELDFLHKNGSIVCLETVLSFIRDDKGAPIGIHGLSRDITERKRAEEALRKSEALYRVLVDTANEGVWSVDADGKTAFVNRQMAEMLQYTVDEMLGRSLLEFTGEEGREQARRYWQRRTNGIREQHDFKFRRKDGSDLWAIVSTTPLLDGANRFAGAFAMITDITERRRAEEALRQGEERYRILVENAPVGIMLVNREGRILQTNSRLIEILGSPSAEATRGINVLSFPLLVEAGISELVRTCMERTEPLTAELPYTSKWGKQLYLRMHLVPSFDSEARVYHCQAVLEDVTERKNAEKALRESEQRLAQIIDFLPDATFVIDEEGKVTSWNRAMEELTGVVAEEIVGKGDHEYSLAFYHERRPVLIDLVRVPNEEIESSYAYVRRRGDMLISETKPASLKLGHVFLWNIARPLYDDTGKVIGAIEVIRDVTELKESETALRESEERYRTLFEQATEAILFVHPEGEIIDANPAALVLLRTGREEVVGADVRGFYWNAADRERYRQEMDREGSVKDFPWTTRTQDGRRRECLINSAAWRDRDGKLIAYLSIIRDVTDARLLEKQLRESQKMEAVGTLAGGIAHDFNNLLQIISGHGELLQTELAARNMRFEELEAMRVAADRGAELVKQILTFSRKVEINLVPVDLNESVTQAERLLFRTIPKMIDIELRLGSQLKLIESDFSHLDQMLLNLALNARDAMPGGGKLVFETANIRPDEHFFKANPDCRRGDYVLLRVSDTGHGIEKADLEHIFEPFFTTKRLGEGTGLGLSTVFGIVKMHGGHITCESEVGRGTTFEIYFPGIEAPRVMGAAQEQAMPAGGTETILVADDEELIGALARKILGRSGYRVITAASGKEAIEVYTREGPNISLVILDLIMPEMGGIQCLEQLLKIDPHVKVLIASGFAVDAANKRFLETASKGTVSKPFNIRQLLGSVRKVLDGLA